MPHNNVRPSPHGRAGRLKRGGHETHRERRGGIFPKEITVNGQNVLVGRSTGKREKKPANENAYLKGAEGT